MVKNPIEKLLDYKIPMFNINNLKIYLINPSTSYYYLTQQNYRFIDNRIYQYLLNLKDKYLNTKTENEKIIHHNLLLLKSILQKITIDELYQYSIKLMYQVSPELGLNTTICVRKSYSPFFKHLPPYYNKNELIKLALNNQLIKKNISIDVLNNQQEYEICKIVSKNDVDFNIILTHTQYLLSSKKKAVIKYYSKYGSFFINKFLREEEKLVSKMLYQMTFEMINLIENAPILDKDYIFYRFITNDNYLEDLKINDIFMDKGFTSFTRDPFYAPSTNKFNFGKVLLKVKFPKDIKGIGVFIELISHFKKEEEFILRPYTKLKLISKNDDYQYYHIDSNFENSIKKKYEFEFVGFEKIPKFDIKIDNVPLIDDLILNGKDYLDKTKNLINKSNNSKEFKIKIDNEEITFNIHYYDSTGAYSKFYYFQVDKGVSLTSYNNLGEVIFHIEINDFISINYYKKWTQNLEKIDTNKLIKIMDFFGKIYQINKIIIHPEYQSFIYSNINNPILDCFGFNYDLYLYLKNNEKRFNNINITNEFSYLLIDSFKDYHKFNSKNLIFMDYLKTLNKINYFDLLLKIIEEKFEFYWDALELSKNFFNPDDNPITNFYYQYNPLTNLYNQGIIQFIPINEKNLEFNFEKSDYYRIYRESFRRI
jgi:hypothetical protein